MASGAPQTKQLVHSVCQPRGTGFPDDSIVIDEYGHYPDHRIINAVAQGAPFTWAPHRTLLLQNQKTGQKALLNLLSRLPLVSLTDADKHIRLINKRMERNEGLVLAG